ncbi:uncharacterized protein LOC132201678 isoform X2 [Neocloeon triangulifer]|uniref:uncharacterized protein LOC132201678 isoform X2 n=1 Tax=Neocloeon triangulifer TaxID=2078957 RepID=UPI00286ECC7E|nr:uncharacterized protein LOC132201678 isoform X2 [Neocloeon triangulifer]
MMAHAAAFCCIFLCLANSVESTLFFVKRNNLDKYFCFSIENGTESELFEGIYWTSEKNGETKALTSENWEVGYFPNDYKDYPTTNYEYMDPDPKKAITNYPDFGFILDHRWEELPNYENDYLEGPLIREISTLRISLLAKEKSTLRFLSKNYHLELTLADKKKTIEVTSHKDGEVSVLKTQKFFKDRWNHIEIKLPPGSEIQEKWTIKFQSEDKNARLKYHNLYGTQYLYNGTNDILNAKEKYPGQNCWVAEFATDNFSSYKFTDGNITNFIRQSSEGKWRNKFILAGNTDQLSGDQSSEGNRKEGDGFFLYTLKRACLPENGQVQMYYRLVKKTESDSTLTCSTTTNSQRVNERIVGTWYNTNEVLQSVAPKLFKPFEGFDLRIDRCNASDEHDTCKGLILCDPNGCSCLRPYTGPTCEEVCQTLGTYGCSYMCGFCKRREECDHVKRSCKGECVLGYRRPNCFEKFLQFRVKPDLFDTKISLKNALENLTQQEIEKIESIDIQFQVEGQDKFQSMRKIVTPFDLKATYELPEQIEFNKTCSFRAVITEKNEEEIFTGPNYPVLHYLFDNKTFFSNRFKQDDSSISKSVLISFFTVAASVVLLVSTLLSWIRKRREQERLISGPYATVQYDKKIKKAQHLRTASTQNLVRPEDGEEMANEDTENIYDELTPLIRKHMDPLKFRSHVENCLKFDYFEKLFHEVKEEVGIQDSDYLAPLSTMVKLQANKAIQTDAYFYDGFSGKNRYVIVKSPSQENVQNFWRLVDQENIQSILIVNDVEPYWPKTLNEEVVYDDIELVCVESQEFCNYSLKIIKICSGGQTRLIRHLQFKSWSDWDLPLNHQAVAEFIQKIDIDWHNKGPILLMCSTKISRVGILLFVHICLDMMDKNQSFDPEYVLSIMLKQNFYLMWSHKLYIFANLVLLEYFTANNAVPCADFADYYKSLQEESVQEEFEGLLTQLKNDLALRKYLCGETKERVDGVTHVDSFTRENQFIVIPKPKPMYLWGFVLQHKIQQIVILNEEIVDQDKFLPTKNHPIEFANVEFQLHSQDETQQMKYLCVKISDSSVAKYAMPTKYINMVILKGWKDVHALPLPSDLISFWENSEKQRKGPWQTLLICKDGSKFCGFYLAIGYLVEKIRMEQLVDVEWAIRKLHQQNINVDLKNTENFKYLFDVSMSYMKSHSTYANFN